MREGGLINFFKIVNSELNISLVYTLLVHNRTNEIEKVVVIIDIKYFYLI